MTRLRVVHQFDSLGESDAGAAYATEVRAEAGAIEAEAYSAVGDGAGRVVIVELWEDEAAYARYWSNLIAGQPHLILDERSRRGTRSIPAEFYRHQNFRLDRIWMSEALAHEIRPAVVWPAAGAVRVVLQLGLSDSPALRDRLVIDRAKTMLEPGCAQYEWLQGVDAATHFLLLELWDDQFLYDNHWQLRLKTGPEESLPMLDRERGSMGIEFYRYQPFHHLYDRWLPADPQRWSETVIWPS